MQRIYKAPRGCCPFCQSPRYKNRGEVQNKEGKLIQYRKCSKCLRAYSVEVILVNPEPDTMPENKMATDIEKPAPPIFHRKKRRRR